MSKRYFAVGDIHGNLKALNQVLERSDFNEEEDTLIGIGDYVDGHDESAEVVQRLVDLPNFIGILGNHDIWFKGYLDYGIPPDGWLNQGGRATYDSYKRTVDSIDWDKHKEFFNRLHLYYILDLNDKKYGFVHGGWTSKLGLGNDEYKDVYYWDRNIWEQASEKRDKHNYVADRWGNFDRIFIGHTATNHMFPDATVPVRGYHGKLINLDQGAGWSGKLTICNIETLECYQSDDAISLYGKVGR